MLAICLIYISLLFPSDTLAAVKGGELSGFKNAVSITSDGKGFIYILDKDNNEIIKLDTFLNVIDRAGSFGTEQLKFYYPTHIDASSGLNIYVTDSRNSRIQRLDLNLAFISELRTDSKTFDEELQFRTPVSSVTVNSKDLFVVDSENRRVVIYSAGAEPVNFFGGVKSTGYKLINPAKIIRDNNNNLYIADENSIAVFNSVGNYLYRINHQPTALSVFNNQAYVLSGDVLYLYEAGRLISEIMSLTPLNLSNITDMLILNPEKYLLLEKNKVSYWTIKK